MNTWGISGSDFLLLYVGLFVISWFVVLAVRQRIAAAAGKAAVLDEPPRLDVYEMAMLNGGGRLALAVAACQLKEAGKLRVEGRALDAGGHLPANADPVETWLYTYVQERDVFASGLPDEDRAEPVLGPVRDRLEKLGLLLTARQRASMRWAVLWFAPLLALGIARVVAGTAHYHPVSYLVILMVATVVVAVNLCLSPRRQLSTSPAVRLFRLPRVTTAGLRVLNDSSGRSGYGSLSAEVSSSTLASQVAMSGVGAILLADAAFAATLGISSASGGSGRGFFGGTGGSGCGGGGCGGGGCGGGGGGGCGG